jgi:hypothetical protein
LGWISEVSKVRSCRRKFGDERKIRERGKIFSTAVIYSEYGGECGVMFE